MEQNLAVRKEISVQRVTISSSTLDWLDSAFLNVFTSAIISNSARGRIYCDSLRKI